jgi:opacity protein-like surface antigen
MGQASGMRQRIVATVGFVLVAAMAAAQEPPSPPISWRFQVVPYFWAAGMKGSIKIQQLPEIQVDVPFSDVISNFDIGILGRFEGRKGDFGLATDVLYMNLGAPFAADQAPIANLEPQVDVRQLVIEGIGFYRMAHSADFERAYVDVLVGTRYLSLRAEVDTTAGASIGSTYGWLDLIGGFRGRAPLGSWAAVLARGDIGGLGSKISYNLEASLDIAISKRWTLGAGYRYLHYDFETGLGDDRRAANLSMGGPLVKATFTY